MELRKQVQKYLLDNKLDDLVLNKSQYKENTPENAKKWVYVSDVVVDFIEWASQKASNEDGALPIQHVGVSLPTENEMYEEMERKFNLGKNHDEGMCIDDTQIGWEECYKWIINRINA